MQEYRVYWFDGAGHVEQAEWIEADSDDAAVEHIRGLNRTAHWELWRGPKRISASQA